jgi:hypothetical protein
MYVNNYLLSESDLRLANADRYISCFCNFVFVMHVHTCYFFKARGSTKNNLSLKRTLYRVIGWNGKAEIFYSEQFDVPLNAKSFPIFI